MLPSILNRLRAPIPMFFKAPLKPSNPNTSYQTLIKASLLVLLFAFIGGLSLVFYFGHELDLYAKQQETSKLQYALSKLEEHLKKTTADYTMCSYSLGHYKAEKF